MLVSVIQLHFIHLKPSTLFSAICSFLREEDFHLSGKSLRKAQKTFGNVGEMVNNTVVAPF